MSKKKLTTIYREVIEDLGFDVTGTGRVQFVLAGVESPFTIKKKALVLPTDEWLKDPDWENTIPFHPLSENTKRKKSEVIEALTAMVSNRIYQGTADLLQFIFELALNTDAHKTLTPEQRDVLRKLPNVSERTVADVHKLLRSKLTFKGETAFANFYVKRSGMWRGEEYSRVAVVTFPLAEQESNEDKKIFDILFRVGDRRALFDILRWIYPGFDNPLENYSYGSRSSVAPNFHALMMAFASMAHELNRVNRIFLEGFEDVIGSRIIGTKWLSNMASLTEYRDEIPPLEGNIGEANEAELTKAKEKAEAREKNKERKELRRDVTVGRRSIIREVDENRGREGRKVSLFGRQEERESGRSVFGRDSSRGEERRSFFDRGDDRRDDDRRGRPVSLFDRRR